MGRGAGPGLVDAARDETSYGEMAGLVAIVLVLLVGLRFLGLVWPVLNDRWHDRDAKGEQMRSRLDLFEEKLDSMDPSGVREEQRIGWARKRLARDRADIAFEEREPIINRGQLVIAWSGGRAALEMAGAVASLRRVSDARMDRDADDRHADRGARANLCR